MKNKIISIVTVGIFLSLFSCNSGTDTSENVENGQAVKPLSRLAFGSCNKENEPEQLWPTIAKHTPDLWVWLGDAQYVSSYDTLAMQKGFDKQKNHPQYQSFIAQVPVVGTWDDHDYGINDAGGEHPNKAAMEDIFLDFVDVPSDAEVRDRRGVYQSFTYGPVGQQVKLILLDTRYFRDSLYKNPEKGLPRYLPNKTGDMLGEEQWKWLENKLTNSSAQVHLIGSSIQIVSSEHGWEKWANLPTAHQRFYDLLNKTSPANPVILSGDRHIAEFSAISLSNLEAPLYEITASGLTHTWSDAWEEQNQYRIGEIIISKNFGLLRFDWENKTISAEVIDPESKIIGSQSIPIL